MFECFSVVPWLRQRLASFEDASLQGMAGEKSLNGIMELVSLQSL